MSGKILCYNAECPFIGRIPFECECRGMCNGFTAFAPKIVTSNRTETRKDGAASDRTITSKERRK